jgi:hypothetical protein
MVYWGSYRQPAALSMRWNHYEMEPLNESHD